MSSEMNCVNCGKTLVYGKGVGKGRGDIPRLGLCRPCWQAGKWQGEGNPRWNNNPDKDALHQRLRSLRGPASDHKCVNCGKQADEWSQIHDTDGTNFEEHYVPRCYFHHRNYDWMITRPDLAAVKKEPRCEA